MIHTRAATDDPVLRAVRAALGSAIPPRGDGAPMVRVAVALSGGRDSMALLDALARVGPESPIELSALHVHHGLSAHADAWAEFCADACASRGVPFTLHRVRVVRKGGASLEASARTARYQVFARADADFVALAHHADDQAETLLLQLLRGAGPHGLAAMPAQRALPAGPTLLRPLLELARAQIDAYVDGRAIPWVDDESNADTGYRRNYIRREIAPRLAAAFPGHPATLVRAAAHQAEAARLLDELAAHDAQQALVGDRLGELQLDREALVALAAGAPHRARNLLRWFLRKHGLPAPSSARLAAMLSQLTRAAPDARVRLAHAGIELGFHQGRIVAHAPAVAAFAIPWRGERTLALPHGTLLFAPDDTTATDRAMLDGIAVVVRPRAGGERIRLAPNRPRQALKRAMHEAGMPAWQRDSLPLVFCGDALAVAPGVGIDVAFLAPPGGSGYAVRWRPALPEV